MSVANIEKLQENTAALCKIGCETLWVSAIRGSGYVYPEKLKCSPLPSGVRILNVKHPGGMVVANFRMWYIRVESGSSRMEWRRQSGVKWRQPDVKWRHSRVESGRSRVEFLPGWNVQDPILLVFWICLRIPKNSPQSLVALVIKKLSKHQNLTQFD